MMKASVTGLALAAAALAALGFGQAALADTTISTFDNFDLDGKFAAWGTATIVSGPTSYEITSSGGYGSGFKDINPNIDGSGNTQIELIVTVEGGSGPTAGPIVSLVDGDGTFWNYAWFGQENGTHTLTAQLSLPTFTSGDGSVSGLDLTTLDFFHLQNDPGGYTGPYKLTFENLRLLVPEPASAALAAGAIMGLALAGRRRR
jgi:hypothetical protein